MSLRWLLPVLVGWWLASWPYRGVTHDSILYTAEALRLLQPDNFRHELFMMFGSQGSYTIFPRLHAWLIADFGVRTAGLILSFTGKIVWVSAFLWLVCSARSWWVRTFALLFLCMQSTVYDALNVFSYAESFATPRLFAEASVLLAAGSLARGRQLAGLVLAVLAVFFHPLMGLGFLAVSCFCLFASGYRRVRWVIGTGLAGSCCVVLVLAANGLAPFSALLRTFDAEWLKVSHARFPELIAEHWSWILAGTYGANFFLLGLAGARADRANRILFWSVCVAGFSAIMIWIAGSNLGNLLVTQLQPWRIIWVVKVLSCLALAQLLCGGALSTQHGRSESAFLLAGFLLDSPVSLPIMMLGVMIGRITKKSAIVSPALDVVSGCVALLSAALAVHRLQMDYLSVSVQAAWILPSVICAVILVVALFVTGRGSESIWRKGALLALLTASLTAGGWAWFSGYSNPFRAYRTEGIPALQREIPEGAVVLSDGGLPWVWFDLRRAHYVSDTQLAGIVFSRQTAVEGYRRMHRLLQTSFPGAKFGWSAEPLELAPGQQVPLSSILFLCEDPALDFVVLKGRYPAGKVFPMGERSAVSVFSCALLRDRERT